MGRISEKYRILEKINGKEDVFIVQELKTGRLFVEKIKYDYNISVYRQLQRMNPKGIARIVELEEINDKLYTVEDYIFGNNLEDLHENGIRFSEKELAKFFIPLCDTLYILHSLEPAIVHRDIKPANLILTEHEELVLIDFNAAKTIHEGINKDTVFMGTQYFAAPEQYGFGQSSNRTDIYGIGATINYLLTNKPVFAGIHDGILHNVLEKCTQMVANARYSDVLELRNALMKIVSLQDTNHNDSNDIVQLVNNKGNLEASMNEKMTNKKLAQSVLFNGYISPHINTEKDVEEGNISSDRLRYTKNALMFVYSNNAINIDKTARNTFFEVYFNGPRNKLPGINILGSNFIKQQMVKMGYEHYTEVKGDLKYNFKIKDEDNVVFICQSLLNAYDSWIEEASKNGF